MTKLPTEGGSYVRDPETAALIRQPDDLPAEPEAEVPEQPVPTNTRKGGK